MCVCVRNYPHIKKPLLCNPFVKFCLSLYENKCFALRFKL